MPRLFRPGLSLLLLFLPATLLAAPPSRREAEAERPRLAPRPWKPRPAACPTGVAVAPATWYVRVDGGDPTRCTGLADAPDPGSGTGRPCALDHLFRLLPPGGPARVAGGDTVVVGPGSYRMGWGAPGATTDLGDCSAGSAWACVMTALPSGASPAQPTRLLGRGWDAGCPSAPSLWGAERAETVLDLAGSSNVEVRCFEVTDHSSCVESHSGGLACEHDTPPYGDWAATGLYAVDSTNVVLADLDIHGLGNAGVLAGRLTDWTVERVRVAGNGWVGWNGDLGEPSSNSGTLAFRHWTVEWNGCGESWPSPAPIGCWAQSAGGYGDGVGTAETLGHWVIEDSAFLHNTSDGLDLLYARPGSSIEVRRTRAEGNAGNQLKLSGPATVENSILVGNCGFFHGQSFTFDVDDCRAAGSALVFSHFPGDRTSVTNTTIASEGDCLVGADCADGQTCTGAEKETFRNNLFVGYPDFLQAGDTTCFLYTETIPGDPFDEDYGLIFNVKDDPCPGAHDLCRSDPKLVSESIDGFDAHLTAASPAIGAALASAAPVDDFDGRTRDAAPDLGAYEYAAAGSCSLACTASVPATAVVGAAASFAGSATADGCTSLPTVLWDFGDGTTSTSAATVHAYPLAGSYAWSFTVTSGSAVCRRSGTIVVGEAVPIGLSWVIPAVAHAPGAAGTSWRTDVAVVNVGSSTASIDLTFTPASGSTRTAALPLAAGAAVEWKDLLVGQLGLPDGDAASGSLRVVSTTKLAMTARTYNQAAAGTFGQSLPALPVASQPDALPAGATGLLPMVRGGTAFRTNVGVANIGTAPASLLVRLVAPDGTPLGSPVEIDVPPLDWRQVSDVFAAAGVAPLPFARATVAYAPSSGGGLAWAYASVVDNATGDPTTVEMVVVR